MRGLQEVDGLVVDVEVSDAAAEASAVPEVPAGEGGLPDLLGQPAQEGGGGDAEELLGALVDEAAGQAAVHPHRQVLAGQQQLHCMGLVVVEDGVAEHGGGGGVAHVQTDPHPAVEELDGQVVVVAVVEQHAGRLCGLDHQGEVERAGGVEGVELQVGALPGQLEGGGEVGPSGAP